MKHCRVNITGIGPVTAAGIGRDVFARRILEPVSRIAAVKLGDKGAVTAAGEVKDFRSSAFALDADHLQSPREIQFALAATMLALRDAGLALAEIRKRQPLVVVARPSSDWERGPDGALVTVAGRKLRPHAVQIAVADLVAGRMESGRGLADSFSSLDAIGYAASQVASGEVDLAICGGADAPLREEILTELKKLGLAPAHANEPARQCRPFDLWRTTGVAGEGACMLVLEAEGSPRRSYASVAGVAQAVETDGQPWAVLAEALRLVLGNAGVRPAEIDCIQADGTGHKALDQAEANALRTALGARLGEIPVVAIKGAIGNALGAAGAIEVGCAALGIRHSMIAPTVNWNHPDPSCRLNLAKAPRVLATGVTLVTGRDAAAGVISCLLLKP
jgi:3-oxoacyl-(acyl-carrier-protein) synthase